MKLNKNATLILEDGNQFIGYSFGANKNVAGELVFNTAMTGYPESLTDPSYTGQMVLFTFPLIGNYGVPKRGIKDGLSIFLESEKIHSIAIIVSNSSTEYSHWNAVSSLSDWLMEENIVGLYGIDTRAVTKLLRKKGNIKAKIIFDNTDDIDFIDPNLNNQVDIVSCNNVITYNEGNYRKKVVLIDCGVKHDIIRNLITRDLCVIRVPWDYDFNTLDFDGLFISNGPGNPNFCDKTVHHIKQILNTNKPICGICMGNQLLAKADKVLILKPLTYMNLSGQAVVAVMRKHKIAPENLIVFMDDLYIDKGNIRVRFGGSGGGHNGIRSIDELLKTNKYTKIKIGIKPEKPPHSMANYVLSKIKDQPIIDEALSKAVEAATMLLGGEGLEKVQGLYNVRNE